MSDELIKPSDQFRREIEPALDDYLKDVGSERLANNLARAIDHQVDWTFEYYKKVDRLCHVVLYSTCRHPVQRKCLANLRAIITPG